MQSVLDSSVSTRRRVLEALTADLSLGCGGAPARLSCLAELSDADDPAQHFTDTVDMIRAFSGKALSFSTAVAVGSDFGFNLCTEISPRMLFERGLGGNVEKAARFLEMLKDKAFRVGAPEEEAPLPAAKRRRLPLDTLVDAAAGGGDDGGGGCGEDSFICYGKQITYERLREAYDELAATMTETSKGFWGKLADMVGVPTLAQKNSATGRSGAVHSKFCKHFNHPFRSAVGAK